MSHFRAALRLAAASVAAMLSFAAPASAQSEQPPKPGGTLEIGTVYVTLSALSLGSRRLELEAQPRHRRGLRAAVRRRPLEVQAARRQASVLCRRLDPVRRDQGELAENWEWKQNPLRLEINLRKGVMFPDKPGVMAARELVADDVVFAYNRLDKSPKKIAGYFDHRRQGRGDRQAHRRLHLQELQRRMGLPLRLGLLLRHHAEGSRRRRRQQLEERQRHRPVPAHRLRAGQLQHLRQEPELLGHGEDQRRRVQAAVRRQGRLSHDQGRGDLPHRAAHRQARHPRDDPLVGGRRAEEERAAAASGRDGCR